MPTVLRDVAPLAVACAGAAIALLALHFRVTRLEQSVAGLVRQQREDRAQEAKEAMEQSSRLAALEREVMAVRLVQQQATSAAREGGGEGTRAAVAKEPHVAAGGSGGEQHQVQSWTPEETIKWVESVVGNDSQSHHFATIHGPALLDMILDSEHGFSFGDKCFFLGVEREACNLLEHAADALIKL